MTDIHDCATLIQHLFGERPIERKHLHNLTHQPPKLCHRKDTSHGFFTSKANPMISRYYSVTTWGLHHRSTISLTLPEAGGRVSWGVPGRSKTAVMSSIIWGELKK